MKDARGAHPDQAVGRVNRNPGTHGFICECSLRSCRKRVYLQPADFRWLAALGAVLDRDCAERDARLVLANFNGAVAVGTRFTGGGRVDAIDMDRPASAY